MSRPVHVIVDAVQVYGQYGLANHSEEPERIKEVHELEERKVHQGVAATVGEEEEGERPRMNLCTRADTVTIHHVEYFTEYLDLYSSATTYQNPSSIRARLSS